VAESNKWLDEAKRALFGPPAGAPGRRPAQDPAKNSKRDQDLIKNRKAAEQAQAAKTAKLRALRLAKESEDKVLAQAEAAKGGPRKRARSRAAPPPAEAREDSQVATAPAVDEERGA